MLLNYRGVEASMDDNIHAKKSIHLKILERMPVLNGHGMDPQIFISVFFNECKFGMDIAWTLSPEKTTVVRQVGEIYDLKKVYKK